MSQITTLLVQPSGSMVYHLVIAFIFISVLQPAMSFLTLDEDENKRKRLLTGVTLLIASRLLIFAFSLAAIMQNNFLSNSLGVIELIILAFDVVIVIWLFAYPDENKQGDIGLTIFSLLILLGGMVSAIFWGLRGDHGALNQSLTGTLWQAVTIAILIIGILALNAEKTPARSQGIIMLVILLLGEAVQLITPVAEGDFFPIARLAHLVAFPLLSGILANYFRPATSAEPEIASMKEHINITSAPLSKAEVQIQAVEAVKEVIEEKKPIDPSSIVTAPLDALVDVAPKLKRGDPEASAKLALDLHIYQNGLALAAANTPKEICQLFTRLTAHAVVADLCLLLTPPDQNFQVHLVCGYDLIVQESLQSTSFDSGLIPRYDKLFENGRALHVLDRGNEKMYDLARILQVQEINNLLAVPVMNDDDVVIAAVVLLSPYSKHVWNADDQEYMKAASHTINEVLQKALAPHRNERAMENLNQELTLSNTDKQQLVREKEALEQQIADLQERLAANETPETGGLNWKEQKSVLEHNLKALEEENETLNTRFEELIAKAKTITEEHGKLLEENESLRMETQTSQDAQAQIDAMAVANQELAEKNQVFLEQNQELTIRLAELVEENKSLTSNLANIEAVSEESSLKDNEALQNALHQAREYETRLNEANDALQSLMEFRNGSNGDLFPEEQAEVIASISQELRQPLSSISGYTDLLISESVGILGALQKKFLERVKASTERMHQLIDDLIQVSTLDSGKYLFTVQPLELMEVIDTAIETTSTQFREKQLSLRVDIHPHLPKLHTDKDALQQILLNLMQNAGAATPEKGEIMLKAQMYDKTQNDVILLSVADTGGGIP
ncbi:MAG: histidine kinase dimerization/phospho-acceptor domain-containing protein, partial [Anaerolineales bacterium]